MSNSRSIPWGYLRWPFAVSIVAYLIHSARSGATQIDVQAVAWTWIVLAVVCRLGSFGLTVSRWFFLLRAQSRSFRFVEIFRLGCLGNAMNYVVPGTVGGDVAKTVLASRDKNCSVTVVAATVLLDRLIGVLGIALLGFVAGCLQPELLEVSELSLGIAVFGIASAVGVAGLLLALQPSVLEWRIVRWLETVRFVGGIFKEIVNSLRLYQTRRRVIWQSVLISVAGHCCNVLAFGCCVVGLGVSTMAPAFGTYFVLFPVVEIVASVLPLPGGVGAREGGVQVLFVAIVSGAGAASAGLFSALAFSGVSIVVAAMCGVVAVSKLGRIRSERDHASVELPCATAGAVQ